MLSHCSFVDRLIDKSKSYGTKVSVITEENTSRTCTCCGNIKHDLKGSKIFDCQRCGVKIDRDLNGSINIMKKYALSKLIL